MTKPYGKKEYLFDVKLFAAIRDPVSFRACRGDRRLTLT